MYLSHFCDKKVQNFLEWSKNSWSPDEHIWATISRYHRLPGAYPSHRKYEFNEVHARTRLVKWGGLDRPGDHSGYLVDAEGGHGKQNEVKRVHMYPPCQGQYLRGVCVYGYKDVPWLISNRHWFANKFDPRIDHLAVECLDSYLRRRALVQGAENFSGAI